MQSSMRHKSVNICLVSAKDVMEHFAFPGNMDFSKNDRRIFMYCSWKAHVFYNIHLWNNVYNQWITSNFPFRWHRTTSTTRGWKSPIFNRNSSGERRLKFVVSGEDDDDKKPRAKRREHRLTQTQTSRFSLNRKQRSLLLYVICVQCTKFWAELGTINIWTNCQFIWSGKVYIWLSGTFKNYSSDNHVSTSSCMLRTEKLTNFNMNLYVDVQYKFHSCMDICFSCMYSNKCEHFHKWCGTLYWDNSVLMRVPCIQ